MQLIPLIYKTLELENKSWTPQNHNPSSAGFVYADGRVIGPDLLSMYYKWKGVPVTNPTDGKSILKMKFGDGCHDQIAKILTKAGIKAKSEVPGKIDLPGLKYKLSYRIDGEYEDQGQLQVLEVKSTDDSGMFGNAFYGGIKSEGPKEDHLLQVICYLNAEPGVKSAKLIYVARDTGEMLEYDINRLEGDKYTINDKPIPEISFAGIVKRWKELEDALERSEPPSPSYHAWVKYNEDGSFDSVMKIKQIGGKKYKSDWRTLFDSYGTKIWSDPKNKPFTYNEIYRAKGVYSGA